MVSHENYFKLFQACKCFCITSNALICSLNCGKAFENSLNNFRFLAHNRTHLSLHTLLYPLPVSQEGIYLASQINTNVLSLSYAFMVQDARVIWVSTSAVLIVYNQLQANTVIDS